MFLETCPLCIFFLSIEIHSKIILETDLFLCLCLYIFIQTYFCLYYLCYFYLKTIIKCYLSTSIQITNKL